MAANLNLNNVCRLCLKPNSAGNMICLYDSEKVNYFGQAVLHFASIKISKRDEILPNSMCKMCLILLKHCIYFKLMCEASDKKLNNAQKQLVEDKFDLTKHKKDRLQPNKTRLKNESISTDQEMDENSIDSLINEINLNNKQSGKTKPQQQNVDVILDILEKSVPLVAEDRFDLNNYEDPSKHSHIKSQTSRTRHRMDICNMERKRTCPICLKSLANPSSFWKHMRTHSRKHRLICEHCGMSFATFGGLNGHMVVIHGTGNYIQCPQCPFKASRRFEMNEHERIHTGERPFACEKCGLTFRRKEIYRKHLFIHSERTIQCKECPKMFFTREHMMGHYNSVHKRYMFMCYECGVLYAKNGTVRRHLLEKHGIPRKDQKKLERVKAGDTL